MHFGGFYPHIETVLGGIKTYGVAYGGIWGVYEGHRRDIGGVREAYRRHVGGVLQLV